MAIKKVTLPDNSTQDINDERIASTDITNWNGKQDALVSGTNIKTVNNESLLGSGNITVAGEQGDDGVGIASVVQTTESTVSGGTNVITVTKTDGTTSTFNVRNGDAVGSATIVQTTGDSTTSVMSQDGTTKALSEAMQKIKAGTSCVFKNYTVTKLSATQVAAINAAEEITIKWVLKSPGIASRFRDTTVLSLNPYYQIWFSSFQSISVKSSLDPGGNWLGKYVNGDNTSQSKNRCGANQCVVINRVTGRVRWYEGTTLAVDETSNDYKAEKFVSDDGLISFWSGDVETRFYSLQIYDSDISYCWPHPNTTAPMGMIWVSGNGSDVPWVISNNLRKWGYQFWSIGERREFASMSGGTTGGANSDANPYYAQFTEGTAVSGTSKVALASYAASGGGAYTYEWMNKFKIVRFSINVTGGVVSIPTTYAGRGGNTYRPWAKVYDSNNNLVADQTNIGAGDYTVEFLSGVGDGAHVFYVSGSPKITETANVYVKMVCCLMDIRLDTMYDGMLKDGEADTMYPLIHCNGATASNMSSSWNNQLPATVAFSNSPIKEVYYDDGYTNVNINGSDSAPSVNGDVVIWLGDIYYGDAHNRTWKRINNA